MKKYIINETTNPFDDDLITAHPHYEALYRSLDALKYSRLRFERFINPLWRLNVLVNRWNIKRTDSDGEPINYETVELGNHDIVYVDLENKNATPQLVKQLKNVAARLRRVTAAIQDVEAQIKALHQDAAADYIRMQSEKFQKESVKDQPKAIYYYDIHGRRKWMINPAVTLENPGYSGSAEHHQYNKKAVITFFELSQVLAESGLGRFEAIYAGADDEGEESVIAVSPMHVLVWEFRIAKGKQPINRLHIAFRGEVNAKDLTEVTERVSIISSVQSAITKLQAQQP